MNHSYAHISSSGRARCSYVLPRGGLEGVVIAKSRRRDVLMPVVKSAGMERTPDIEGAKAIKFLVLPKAKCTAGRRTSAWNRVTE